MIKQHLLIMFCMGMVVALTGYAETTLPIPKHDPFARPVLKKAERFKTHPGNTLAEPKKSWKPVLTSVLQAGPDSMAIVNGQVVKIGEQVEGYRLLEVGEQDALFEKDGHKIRLRLGLI